MGADGLDEAFLAAADLCVAAVSAPAVQSSWAEPSALAQMTVGALACHLGRQLVRVAELGTVATDAEPIAASDHYARAAWVTAESLEDPAMDRSADEAEAELGFDALVRRTRAAHESVRRLLTDGTAQDVVFVPWQGWALRRDQFLLTRLVEITVHLDDLCASTGTALPGVPDEVFVPVSHLLTDLAVSRHGQSAVLRALSRKERAPASISAF